MSGNETNPPLKAVCLETDFELAVEVRGGIDRRQWNRQREVLIRALYIPLAIRERDMTGLVVRAVCVPAVRVFGRRMQASRNLVSWNTLELEYRSTPSLLESRNERFITNFCNDLTYLIQGLADPFISIL